VHLSREALYKGTAKLPPVSFCRTDHVLATNTTEAVQSGCYWGYVGMIEGLVTRLRKECIPLFGVNTIGVIATGGLSSIFSGDLPCIEHVREDLTIEGLRLLFEQNSQHAITSGIVM